MHSLWQSRMERCSPTRTHQARYCIMYLSGKDNNAVCDRTHCNYAGVFALPVLILTTTVVCVKLQVGLS